MQISDAGMNLVKDYVGTKHPPGLSAAQADDALRAQLADAEDAVNDWVLVDLTQGQFDSLVSLTSDIGCDEFERSALLRLLNQGRYLDAANEFQRHSVEGKDVQLALVRRRLSEKRRFMEKDS